MAKFCIVVINYRGANLTCQMYESVVKSSWFVNTFRFVVVNNSEDQSEKRQLYDTLGQKEDVTIIDTPNVGYFQGINAGLRAVDTSGYDYIVVGNNDLEFEPGFFDILGQKSYSLEVFAVCPDVVTNDGVHQNPHVKKPYGFLKKLKLDIYYSNFYLSRALWVLKNALPDRRGRKKYLNPVEIHMGIGAVYILTRSFFESNSELEYPLFLYGEEAFLSNQIHKDGGILIYEPDLIVHHEFSATTSQIPNRTRYSWSQQSYRIHRKYL